MYSRRISLLSCCQIPIPLPLILQQAELEAQRAQQSASPAKRPSTDDCAIADIWAPLHPANSDEPRRPKRMDANAASDLLNVWLCPEIDAQIRRERMRRRKALLIAERMGAMVQADRQQQELQRAEARRGRKRKASESAVGHGAEAEPPHSPELAKPQLLLIPELLPKGMLKSRPTVAKPDDRPAVPPSVLSQSRSDGNSKESFDLGLDLGFDIAQSGSDMCAQQATSSAILEITDFLERDIDVFTPSAMARTPRTAATFTAKPGPIDALPALSSDKQQDLIEDILNFSL
ncbi:hypothetical protein H4S01_001084 [Coemansia sp. RSA 2610]|nr:hypothetical protein H4S01_001084 [Coemansia sp. RSA 2610]